MQARLENDSDGIDIAIDRYIWEGVHPRAGLRVVHLGLMWI